MTHTIDGKCAKCGEEKGVNHMEETAIKQLKEAFERAKKERDNG